MPRVTQAELLIAAVIWIGIMYLVADFSACRPRCGSGDLIMTAIIAIGMIVPALVGANIIWTILGRDGRD